MRSESPGRAGHWNDAFLGEKDPDYPFALEFVASNVSAGFLYRQYRQAQAGEDNGYCLGDHGQPGHCLGCGACLDEEQRRAIIDHQIHQPEREPYVTQMREVSRASDVIARKRRLQPAYFVLRVDPLLAGVLPECLNAFVFRDILNRYPELVDNLLAVRESLFTLRPNAGRFPAVGGETVFAMKAWDVTALETGFFGKNPVSGPQLVQILRSAEGFVPGVFTQLHLDVHLPSDFFPEPRARLEEYLRGAYLRYSLRREGGCYRFDLPPKALKKKILFGGFFEVREEGLFASLNVGPKFDLAAFLRTFGPPNLSHRARVQASGIEW